MAEDGEATGTTRRERLVQRRKALGLTQEDLAGLLGVERSTVVRWELGETGPLPWNRPKLARALHVSADQIADLLAAGPARPDGPATVPEREDATQPGGTRAPAVPRQLPATVADFTGRAAELETLTRILDDAGMGAPGTVVISAIGGTAGVGKTALALHWAHRVAPRFGDGQLYVNLRGFDPSGTPVTPDEAIRGFLDALGVPPNRVPAVQEAQAARYRGLLADRKMLIVLDNARDEWQVRPLLPASPGSLVVVTSRSQLTGLAVADGARLLSLDVLTHDEAVRLFAARIGPLRGAEEPGAIAEIAVLCACLPLALAVAAARAAARPDFPLSSLAAELRDAAGRLDALDAGDPAASVRAVFSWSYQQLGTEAARMFRLLGLHPGPDISVPAAASLAAMTKSRARRLLGDLARTHLITEHMPGRYALHDLLRAYAAAQARDCDSASDRTAATNRLLGHYLHTAGPGSILLDLAREPIALGAAGSGIAPEPLAGAQQALAWFATEHEVLLAAVACAAGSGFDAIAWQLSWALVPFLESRGRYQERAAILDTALAAATRLGDTAGQAVCCRLVANALNQLGHHDRALAYCAESLRLYRRTGNRLGEALVHETLGELAMRQGNHPDALAHAEQTLSLYQAAGHKQGELKALGNIGWSHALLGDYRQARAFCRLALALNAEVGNRRTEERIWDSLGYAESCLGNFSEAFACYQRAGALARELGHVRHEMEALTHLGDAYQAAGQLPRAREAWQQALAVLGDPDHPEAGPIRAKLASTGDQR
jgi:tetratricopeptide (TPR) repeat protein/transcriptional regulator with XRE-family HTH domain